MVPGGSKSHSQVVSNNTYPESNQPSSSCCHLFILRSILISASHLHLGLPKGLFPVGLAVKILKAFPPSSILATCHVYLNLLDLYHRYNLRSLFIRHGKPKSHLFRTNRQSVIFNFKNSNSTQNINSQYSTTNRPLELNWKIHI